MKNKITGSVVVRFNPAADRSALPFSNQNSGCNNRGGPHTRKSLSLSHGIQHAFVTHKTFCFSAFLFFRFISPRTLSRFFCSCSFQRCVSFSSDELSPCLLSPISAINHRFIGGPSLIFPLSYAPYDGKDGERPTVFPISFST